MAESLLSRLKALRPEMAAAAQGVLDSWEQDDEGFDEDLGHGGACDRVSEALSDVVGSLDGVQVEEGGHEGDDHAWLIAYDDSEAVGVDIPPGVYETGSGYSWRKRKGVRVGPEDVVLWEIDRSDLDLPSGLASSFERSSDGPGMDLSDMAARVASMSVESARRRRRPKGRRRPSPSRQQVVRSQEVRDDVLRSGSEYACQVELSLTARFEGKTDRRKLLSKIKLELTNAIRAGMTTTARELNLASLGVKVQPLRLECDVVPSPED